MSSKEEEVEDSQSKVNRIMEKHFENIVILRRSRPQALTIWEKKYAVKLLTVGGLDLAVKEIRERKSAS